MTTSTEAQLKTLKLLEIRYRQFSLHSPWEMFSLLDSAFSLGVSVQIQGDTTYFMYDQIMLTEILNDSFGTMKAIVNE